MGNFSDIQKHMKDDVDDRVGTMTDILLKDATIDGDHASTTNEAYDDCLKVMDVTPKQAAAVREANRGFGVAVAATAGILANEAMKKSTNVDQFKFTAKAGGNNQIKTVTKRNASYRNPTDPSKTIEKTGVTTLSFKTSYKTADMRSVLAATSEMIASAK